MFVYASIAVLLCLCYLIITHLVTSFSAARKAKSLGCGPIPQYPRRWYDLLGYQVMEEAQSASKQHRGPQHHLHRLELMGTLVGRPVKTFGINVLGNTIIFTSDPKVVQAVLATQFADFELSGQREKNFFDLLGHGIFTTNGKMWEHSRALLRPSFARQRVGDLELEDRHNRNLLSVISTDPSSHWTPEIDLQVLFFRLTIDSSTEFLFGESVLSQLSEVPNAIVEKRGGGEEVFAKSFDVAQRVIAERGRLRGLYWLVNNTEFKRACKDCHDFIDHFVRLALNKNLKEKQLEAGTVKDKGQYIFLEELAQRTQDPIELRSQLLNILLAGRDTTASMLGWLFFLLARDPERYQSLRQAIVDDFGDANNPQEITFAKLKDCRYLQACLNETLRLFPVVPINSRMANKDTTIPRGGGPDGSQPVFIRKGQDVVYSVYCMHRDKDIWGSDANQFKPERWEGRRMGWEYAPFNGGPRICLGQQFALTSAGYATVMLLQRFDKLENLDPVLEAKQNATLTSCSANGVKVRLHEAQ